MIEILYIILLLAFILSMIRFYRGPSNLDRILSLDVMALLIMGMMMIYAIEKDSTSLLDVIWIPAVTSFMTTIIFAYTSEKLKQQESER